MKKQQLTGVSGHDNASTSQFSRKLFCDLSENPEHTYLRHFFYKLSMASDTGHKQHLSYVTSSSSDFSGKLTPAFYIVFKCIESNLYWYYYY